MIPLSKRAVCDIQRFSENVSPIPIDEHETFGVSLSYLRYASNVKQLFDPNSQCRVYLVFSEGV